MNNFSGIGRVGRDATQRYTPNGKAVTNWSVAIDVGFGENKQTLWLDCSGWGDRFGKLAEYIKKGDRIGVFGEIGMREHDGKTYVTLNVRDVTLLGQKRDGEQQPRLARNASAPSNTPSGPGGAADFEGDEIPFLARGKRSHFI